MTKFMITTSFGLESLVKWQLKDMGYENFKLSDGQIILDTRLDDVGKLNINLREADRVYLILKTFEAKEFDQLFEGIKAINWPDLLDKDSNFIVGARTYKSKLFSVRTIQSISEKAIVESMKV